MSNVPDSYDNEDEIGQDLSLFTLQHYWDDVVEIYRRYPWTHTAEINSYQDTALHVAADSGQEETVKQLLDAILKPQNEQEQVDHDNELDPDPEINDEQEDICPKALAMRNMKGDTPLHLAASRGFSNICHWIARVNWKLLDIRNNNGETPLFLAALNWHRETFLLLYFRLCDAGRDVESHFRQNNGDTILHLAIRREYFELAIILTKIKGELVGYVNEKGMTCLDILATKPSAFKSSSSLGWWKEILYSFIHVPKSDDQIENRRKEIKRKYPDTEIELTKEENKKCYVITSIWRRVVTLFGSDGDKKAKADTENPDISVENKDQKANTESSKKNQHQNVQPNDGIIYEFVKNALHYLGHEFIRIKKMKEKHVWSAQILEELRNHFTKRDGKQPFRKDASELSKLKKILKPQNKVENKQETRNERKEVDTTFMEARKHGVVEIVDMICKEVDTTLLEARKHVENKQETKNERKEVYTAFLEAGKHGIVEIVNLILEYSPVAIHEKTSEGRKNILLVAVENRQPRIVQRLQTEKLWNSLMLGKDTENNTILHLAAKASTYKPWRIPGSAMQMLWEIKWYQYVKELVPTYMPFQVNKEGKTPGEVFTEAHNKLVDDSSDWLKDTSNSCSVVAALIAGVSFATSSSVPGGTNDQGKAPLGEHPAFALFAVSSLASLCFSITALIMFLSILTSRKQAKDFRKDLPIKLLLGLSSLFLAIASTLVAFCSANFFELQDKFKDILLPIYAATCLPVSFYAIAQFPLYVDLVVAIFTKTPQRSGWKDHI